MLESLKTLLESGLLNQKTQQEISEAWETKLTEARNEIRSEIRNEFAERYAHDKSLIEGSLDKIVNETLQNQINTLQAEKDKISKDRVVAINRMQETAKSFKNFLTKKLAEEIQEFRKERSVHKSASKQLESFVISSLAEEINEFAIDKKDLTTTKVKLVSEAKNQLNTLKKKFVARSSKMVQEAVTKQLRKELSQLREDISAAKKNNFGRKIFETFATEFASSYLNENAEIRKVTNELNTTKNKLAEARKSQVKAKRLIENKDREILNIKSNDKRKAIITELLNPLVKEKAQVMNQLLESVQTDRLRSAFDKYLPAVLEAQRGHKVLNETKTVTAATGNKNTVQVQNDGEGLTDIKRLAGL